MSPITVYHPRYKTLQLGLAALRKKAGLSQVQLAQRLGVGQSLISKIERGESYVDVLFFVDWCWACEVPSVGQALDALIADERLSDKIKNDSYQRFPHKG